MTRPLVIAHLYPKEMSIYGDRGNILTLVQRLAWRGLAAEVLEVPSGEPCNFADVDVVFAGGGQDRGQELVAADLQSRSDDLHAAASSGVVMLVVCGTYQLFGRRFVTLGGAELSGIGIFGAETVATKRRMVGNVVIDSEWGQLVGFENHSGETVLDHDQPPLGRVVHGYGNSGDGIAEGAVRDHVYGTYLHGPLLPKNPAFADHLLLTAVQRAGIADTLEPLDDRWEHAAASVARALPQ